MKSIWGAEDKATLELLTNTDISGTWLNLGAGDGRYNLTLLDKVDYLIASDIDTKALNRLRENTPTKYQSKLEINPFDMTQKFPFENDSFDGVFSTGTLHLFPKETARTIFHEINRVLRPHGKVVIDFATDIKRILPNGKLYKWGNEPQYTLKDAKEFLKDIFQNYKKQFYESEVLPETVKPKGSLSYEFSCKFVLLVAEKSK